MTQFRLINIIVSKSANERLHKGMWGRLETRFLREQSETETKENWAVHHSILRHDAATASHSWFVFDAPSCPSPCTRRGFTFLGLTASPAPAAVGRDIGLFLVGWHVRFFQPGIPNNTRTDDSAGKITNGHIMKLRFMQPSKIPTPTPAQAPAQVYALLTWT
jgi:hypothetical protein